MYAALLFISVLQFTNLNLVSTFVTCRNAYNYENYNQCYHNSCKYNVIPFQYKKTSNLHNCQKWCDEDSKCTQYFYNGYLNGCYLSQCKDPEACDDKYMICCPWMRYIKVQESEHKECSPEVYSIIFTGSAAVLVALLGIVYCQVRYSYRKKKRRRQATIRQRLASRQSSSAMFSDAVEENIHTDIEGVTNIVPSPPPCFGSKLRNDPEFQLRYSSIRRFGKLTERDTKILEEVKGTLKCALCSKPYNNVEHKPILLIDCGHTVCKECFLKNESQTCQQDNCGKVIKNDEFDNFQISEVMEAKNDIEVIKALECVICFEVYNMEVNTPRILNHCGHTICCSCMANVFNCPQCRKSFFHLRSNENNAVRKILELDSFLV